jgi:hypothetical protein
MFNFSVIDTVPPVVICPPDINEPNDPGQTSRWVEWVEPSYATDNLQGQIR